jgi:serine/threonine protein kinase
VHSLPPPPRDAIEHRRAVALAEAKLFGGEPAPVTVGRFRVGRKLGEGALGVVYAAEDPQLERPVALKLLRTAWFGGDAVAWRPTILREARAMARLAHPNVVTVHEVGEDGDHVYIVMELIAGATLKAWLATPRGWRRVLDAFVEAGRGLASAHEAGLVHRDFKPDNVLVGDDGRTRVTDFGLARALEEHTVAVEGTPAYMAPEQRRGEPPTPAADQFSFCVALYEGLYGRRPFADDDPCTAALPPPPGEVPTLVWQTLRRGLALDPHDRWSTMSALLSELRPEPRPRRRTIALVALSILIAILLTGAYLQLRMFAAWFAEARP